MDKIDSSVTAVSPHDLPLSSNHAAQERLSQLHEKIFGNPLILNEVIRQCLHSTETSLSSYIARNLRLVSSTWWKETTEIFVRNTNKPLFAFTMFHPSPMISYRSPGRERKTALEKEKMEKLLDFFSCLLDGSLEMPPPPFSLTVITNEPFKCATDTWFLYKIFKENSLISSSLVKLTISDEEQSRNQHTHTFYPVVPSNMKLSCLQHVEYKMDCNMTGNFLAFMNAILSAAVNLKKLSLEVPVLKHSVYWTIPSTLTHLTVHTENILTRLSTFNQSNSTTHITFPRLKSLEVFGHARTSRNLDNSIMNTFIATMANLEKLKFRDMQTKDLKIWFELRMWPTVNALELEKVEAISQETMTSIHKSFPMLNNLTLPFYLTTPYPQNQPLPDAMHYLFQEMTQLKSLKISIIFCHFQYLHVQLEEYMLDYVFLGITPGKVTLLRQNSTLWKDFVKEDDQTGQFSGGIRRLRDLKRLDLGCSFSTLISGGNPNNGQPPKPISPLGFRLGFMQLPHQLDHLTLRDGFSVGMADIGKEWLEQSDTGGRTLVIG